MFGKAVVHKKEMCLAGCKEARLKPICACHKSLLIADSQSWDETGMAKKEEKKKRKRK